MALVVGMDVVLAAHQRPRANECNVLRHRGAVVGAGQREVGRLEESRRISHGGLVGAVELAELVVEHDDTRLGLLGHRLTTGAGQPLVQEGVVVVHAVNGQSGIGRAQAAQDQGQIGGDLAQARLQAGRVDTGRPDAPVHVVGADVDGQHLHLAGMGAQERLGVAQLGPSGVRATRPVDDRGARGPAAPQILQLEARVTGELVLVDQADIVVGCGAGTGSRSEGVPHGHVVLDRRGGLRRSRRSGQGGQTDRHARQQPQHGQDEGRPTADDGPWRRWNAPTW